MSTKRLVIAGTGSGVGKTTTTLGLMAALKSKGLQVQGFKCGPDYIDSSYHTAVTKRISRNLDSWMFSEETLLDILTYASEDADITIMEGVMGLFDGRDPLSNVGSTAHVSMLTKSPILLVVNCQSMARSAAAVVKGFQTFAEDVNVIGVIANKVGSEGHYKLVKEAIEQECGIPVIGYLKREMGIEIPERSHGLIPSIERGDLDDFFAKLGELVSETVDLDRLLELASAPALPERTGVSIFDRKEEEKVTIAVARDAAFNTYYAENFELLQSYGAKIIYFSPLENEEVPKEADGLYIGGNLPEEFAWRLSENKRAKQSILEAIERGLPTVAEGGGLMYFTESYTTTKEETYDMVGLIPAKIKIENRLKAIGYRDVRGSDANFLLGEADHVKGHEFHYASFETSEELPYAYETEGRFGAKKEGFVKGQFVASLTQLHFASNPEVAKRFVQQCVKTKEGV